MVRQGRRWGPSAIAVSVLLVLAVLLYVGPVGHSYRENGDFRTCIDAIPEDVWEDPDAARLAGQTCAQVCVGNSGVLIDLGTWFYERLNDDGAMCDVVELSDLFP